MKIMFREAAEKDINQMVNLFKNLKEEKAGVSFTEYDDEDKIYEWFKNNNIYIYVAENAGKIVGVFKALRGEEDKKHSAFLTAATDINFRGKNIARELTLYGIGRLRGEGIKIVRAYVFSDNKPSINTILSCGFQFSGNVHMHHYDKEKGIYVDDLIFHKMIG